jgi:hypothetical protein
MLWRPRRREENNIEMNVKVWGVDRTEVARDRVQC